MDIFVNNEIGELVASFKSAHGTNVEEVLETLPAGAGFLVDEDGAIVNAKRRVLPPGTYTFKLKKTRDGDSSPRQKHPGLHEPVSSSCYVVSFLLRKPWLVGFIFLSSLCNTNLVSQVQREMLQFHQQQLQSITTASGSTSSAADAVTPIINILQNLSLFDLRFYMYMEDAISHKKRYWPDALMNMNLTDTSVNDNVRIFLPFESHPLRTTNPKEAALFLVPTPWALGDDAKEIPPTIQALLAQPSFRDGHGHFFMSASPTRIFDVNYPGTRRRKVFRKWGPKVANMTLFKDKDDPSVLHLCGMYLNGHSVGDWTGHFCRHGRLYLQTSISMGVVSLAVPYQPATWERFMEQRTISLFYHSTPYTSFHNSTQYRHALLGPNVTWPESFLPVSVGHTIPRNQWLHDYARSKFCMVIRGDDPASSSLVKAIYNGCIPVIVSDYLPFFSPPFPHLLKMQDYSVMISEQTFMADPVSSVVEALSNWNDTYLRQKLHHLQVAQRIICVDHPESLFVQAVLHEVHRVNPRTPRLLPANNNTRQQ